MYSFVLFVLSTMVSFPLWRATYLTYGLGACLLIFAAQVVLATFRHIHAREQAQAKALLEKLLNK